MDLILLCPYCLTLLKRGQGFRYCPHGIILYRTIPYFYGGCNLHWRFFIVDRLVHRHSRKLWMLFQNRQQYWLQHTLIYRSHRRITGRGALYISKNGAGNILCLMAALLFQKFRYHLLLRIFHAELQCKTSWLFLLSHHDHLMPWESLYSVSKPLAFA